jgi:nucleoid-associated protein YgaU
MTRYNLTSNNVTTRWDGKRVFKTTQYPPIPLDSSDTYIITSSEDFLDALALKFYKDSTLWWIIAQANGIKNSLSPTEGTQLRIPGNVSQIISNFTIANQ